jgi:hypothetical protein
MLAPLIAAASVQSAGTASIADALRLCRPTLEKRVSGEISAIDVEASLSRRGWTVIRGPMRALIGMGEPPPGSASTHHLIRADYDFICWVNDSRIKKIEVNRKY